MPRKSEKNYVAVGAIPCPACGHGASAVKDSRSWTTKPGAIFRKRQCEACAHRFSTREALYNAEESDHLIALAANIRPRLRALIQDITIMMDDR